MNLHEPPDAFVGLCYSIKKKLKSGRRHVPSSTFRLLTLSFHFNGYRFIFKAFENSLPLLPPKKKTPLVNASYYETITDNLIM